MKYFIIIILALSAQVSAKMLISPFDAIVQTFGENITVKKKNVLLTSTQAKKIGDDARVKLNSKIFRVFKAQKDSKDIAYGILINRKVRSKNAVILYIIDDKSILKTIEIIAFNEPIEYIPSKTWQSQFREIPTDKKLKLSKDIPIITGATLSARSVVDGSRLAFSFYNEILKAK